MTKRNQFDWKFIDAPLRGLGWIPSVVLGVGAHRLQQSLPVSDEALSLAAHTVAYMMAALAACLLVAWFSWVIYRMRPHGRLRSLVPDLRAAHGSITPSFAPSGDWYVTNFAEDNSTIRALVHKLDKLAINHPGLDSTYDAWDRYLSRLTGEAQAGALSEARNVWDDLVD
ncbi:MAG: hypothetical protein OXQ89_20210 [Rhodospirillaceae bacterium]|nr:hypothetical protein [Rhodospirillaceae bacterium]MDE0000074.1 hypothetical protein [Rhodospirillaceae bacterium]MDE0361314.1 hypothetical protein [Rhodospirillaceae bacterium]